MSLVDRIGVETRTIGGVPWQPWRNPYWRFNIGGPVHPSRMVQGQDAVLGLSALYGCVRFIADQVASTPIRVYRRLPDGSSQRVYSSMLLGDEVAGGGPQPPGDTLYDWKFAGTAAALLHGTSWGLVTNRGGIPGSDGFGLPTGIAWLPPDRMSVQDDEQQPENPLRSRIYYNGRLMDRSDLRMMKAFSVPGRVDGISPIQAFSVLISQGLQALDYSNTWFDNGGFPIGTFQNLNEEVDEQQAKQIRTRLVDTLRLHQPLVYGRDWDFKAMTVPPNEAIMIQGMQLNATQIAAIYGVNPVRVGGTRAEGLSYSNVTQDQLEELQSTLKPWFARWEAFLTSMLPATQYARFDYDAVLRMDPHTRNEVYQIQRNMGTRTANEIRADDDKAPLGDIGDDPMPQPLLERMAATTRVIPKSVEPLIIFEADHIAKSIEKMEAAHPELVNPAVADNPPLQLTPETYLGRLMTQVRSGPLFGPPDGRAEPSDVKSAVTMLEQHQRNGTIPEAEARARIDAANHASTCGELAALFDDLPPMYDGEAPSAPRKPASRAGFGAGAQFRAADEDRDLARKMIEAHGRLGRLRAHEVDERSVKASEAVTCGDLDTLFADLPVIEMAALSPPEEDRAGEDVPLFGPAALALVRERAFREEAALAATNGKAH